VTSLERQLREEIAASGPISFARFMDIALYHPEHGYYRRGRNVFGRDGDFYTAEQIQPVFGILVRALVASLWRQMNEPADFQVVELGAGRAEMAEAFASFPYVPVDWSRQVLPDRFQGVVFANEFFDALPVHVLRRRNGSYNEMLVTHDGDRFRWIEGGKAADELEEYARHYTADTEEMEIVEVNLEALQWIERIARRLENGYVVLIDYGYTRWESARFRSGTLMSYQRHVATDDVLSDPGDKDITSHVNFTALEGAAHANGLDVIRFETLSQTLLRAGEADHFAEALRGGSDRETVRRQLQLKTLLFGMGQTFRTMVMQKGGAK